MSLGQPPGRGFVHVRLQNPTTGVIPAIRIALPLVAPVEASVARKTRLGVAPTGVRPLQGGGNSPPPEPPPHARRVTRHMCRRRGHPLRHRRRVLLRGFRGDPRSGDRRPPQPGAAGDEGAHAGRRGAQRGWPVPIPPDPPVRGEPPPAGNRPHRPLPLLAPGQDCPGRLGPADLSLLGPRLSDWS
jgi:hypothetical protein